MSLQGILNILETENHKLGSSAHKNNPAPTATKMQTHIPHQSRYSSKQNINNREEIGHTGGTLKTAANTRIKREQKAIYSSCIVKPHSSGIEPAGTQYLHAGPR